MTTNYTNNTNERRITTNCTNGTNREIGQQITRITRMREIGI